MVLVDGIPAWTRREPDGGLRFRLPDDFWDRPAPSLIRVRALSDGSGADVVWSARIAWPANRPVVRAIAPNPAWLGQPIAVTGSGLVDPARPNGTYVLLNGKEVPLSEVRPDRLVFQAPEGLLVPTRFNLIVQRGREPGALRSWPIPFAVRIPSEKLPHLLSATFSPKELRVGDVLTVTFRVRNNLPYAVPLATRPRPEGARPFTYDERQAWFEMGIPEPPGALHLRVTSDRPAGHDPGSWPWLFGFPMERLESGEEVTVTGQIRVETPGAREFRVGLVAGGSRFIDDNAFRTRIVVRPAR